MITASFENLDGVRNALDKLSKGQIAQAAALAINDTAFMVMGKMVGYMSSSFDRVTPFVQRSPKVFKAEPDRLVASIAPTLDTRNRPSTGGKVGVDPQHVLQAQEFGGRRADKRSEVILRRVGILPHGYQTAIPKSPYPGSDDGRGNLRGPFLTQLLSYLQTFGEQGFKANMTERRKKNLNKGTAKQTGRRYFVAYGRLRDSGAPHLAPGIWAALGTHGSDVRPVLMFVKAASYRPRINLDRFASSIGTQEYLDRRMRYRIRQKIEELGL